MILHRILPAFLLVSGCLTTSAFQSSSIIPNNSSTMKNKITNPLSMTQQTNEDDSRRTFLSQSLAFFVSSIVATNSAAQPANAVIYLDPAMYGDQENRVSAVDSLRESVRRVILQKPSLAPAFYRLALLDGLSYNVKSGEGGPEGRIISAVLASKDESQYMKDLKEVSTALLDSKKNLKKLTSITVADAVALGGAEAIASIGGPELTVQLGRTDAVKGAVYDPSVPLDLFDGNKSSKEIISYFQRSGLTERELTALLGGLMTIETVETNLDPKAWKKSNRPKFREPGKMGRMSEFKRLSDEDIEKELSKDLVGDEDEEEEEDEGWYIADSFGTREQAFGKKAGNLDAKTFNRYLTELYTFSRKRGKPENQTFGWIGALLLNDRELPSGEGWLAKYAASNLNYQKDLSIAYNAITQLGAEYTGGKYENLLKNRPRKTLNDD